MSNKSDEALQYVVNNGPTIAISLAGSVVGGALLGIGGAIVGCIVAPIAVKKLMK